jgi:hypothetical protein
VRVECACWFGVDIHTPEDRRRLLKNAFAHRSCGRASGTAHLSSAAASVPDAREPGSGSSSTPSGVPCAEVRAALRIPRKSVD